MKNHIKNMIGIISWPALFAVGQFFIIFVLTIFFNNNYISNLEKNNPSLSSDQIVEIFNNDIATKDYQMGLSNMIDDNKIWIVLIIFIVLVPVLIKVYKKSIDIKTQKLDIKKVIILITIGSLFAITYNLLLYLINNISYFINMFEIDNNNMISSLITMCLLGPILEELMFRGVIYNKLKKNYNYLSSIIITSIVFALFHTNINQIIYAFIFSFILISSYDKYKTLKAPIIMHISANTSALLLTLLLSIIDIYVAIILFCILFLLSIIYILKILNKRK